MRRDLGLRNVQRGGVGGGQKRLVLLLSAKVFFFNSLARLPICDNYGTYLALGCKRGRGGGGGTKGLFVSALNGVLVKKMLSVVES